MRESTRKQLRKQQERERADAEALEELRQTIPTDLELAGMPLDGEIEMRYARARPPATTSVSRPRDLRAGEPSEPASTRKTGRYADKVSGADRKL